MNKPTRDEAIARLKSIMGDDSKCHIFAGALHKLGNIGGMSHSSQQICQYVTASPELIISALSEVDKFKNFDGYCKHIGEIV